MAFSLPPAQAQNPLEPFTTATGITQEQRDAAVVGKTQALADPHSLPCPSGSAQRGDTQVWYDHFVKIKHVGNKIQEATVCESGTTGLLAAR